MGVWEIREKMLDLQHECTFCALCLRVERMVAGYDSIKKITAGISDLLQTILTGDSASDFQEFSTAIVPLLKEIIESQEKRNISMIADVLERELYMLLAENISRITEAVSEDEIDYYEQNLKALKETGQKEAVALLDETEADSETEYSVVISESGDICFPPVTGTGNPYRDGLEYVFSNSNCEIVDYGLAGIGMVYEVMAFLRVTYGVSFTIIEEDTGFARDVLNFIDLSEYIRAGRLKLCLGKCDGKMAGYIKSGALLTKADAMNSFSQASREMLNKHRSVMLPMTENKQIIYFNFYSNTRLEDPYVVDLADRFKGRKVYLVAGGPSLTGVIQLLKDREEGSIILCVGTSAIRLIDEGISPDYVVLIDGLPATKRQMNVTFDYSRTELIYLATACYESVAMFKGKRYIVYQEGFDPSEQKAAKEKMPLYQTGGSVSTLALDLSIKLGAAEITCLGLDLAYTYNQLHATGVSDDNKITGNEDNIRVKDTHGNEVWTSVVLNSYRLWIEKYLDGRSGIPQIVNISDGAFIKGMKNVPL